MFFPIVKNIKMLIPNSVKNVSLRDIWNMDTAISCQATVLKPRMEYAANAKMDSPCKETTALETCLDVKCMILLQRNV